MLYIILSEVTLLLSHTICLVDNFRMGCRRD
jgi:hypothetical protein